MNTVIEFVKSFNVFDFTNYMTLLLYWLPLSVCAYGYTIQFWKQYRRELAACTEDNYRPSLTIGTIIGHTIIVGLPLANLWMAVFNIGPTLFSGFFSLVGQIFNTPLVGPKKSLIERIKNQDKH
jgi:hypothetical protein